MTKRFSDGDIWQKDWFLNLDDKQKLLTKFLFDNCDCAGVYEISWRMLKIFFTSEITREDFEKIKQVKFLDDNTIFIEDFILFQCSISSINELNPNNNAHKGIIKILKKYNLYLGASEPLVSPSIGAQEKEKEIYKEKDINVISINKDINRDPYINPTKKYFIEQAKEILGFKPYLDASMCNKLIELSAEIDDFQETIPIVLEKIKNKKWKFADGSKDVTVNWLLKDSNYTSVLNGAFDYESREEIVARLEKAELERRKQWKK